MYSHSWSKSRKQKPLWLLVSNKHALFSRHQTTLNGVHTIYWILTRVVGIPQKITLGCLLHVGGPKALDY